MMVVDQLRDYLEHGNVVNAVNFPAVAMARESAFRVAIANANVPNMLGQISTAMAHAGLNIHNMVNKSRGDMAYTLVDVDSAVQRRGARRDPRRSKACCRCATCRRRRLSQRLPGRRAPAAEPAPPDSTRRPRVRSPVPSACAARAGAQWFEHPRSPHGQAEQDPRQRPCPRMPSSTPARSFWTPLAADRGVLLAARAGQDLPEHHAACRCRCASCSSRCCATATARRSRAEHVAELANWQPERRAHRRDPVRRRPRGAAGLHRRAAARRPGRDAQRRRRPGQEPEGDRAAGAGRPGGRPLDHDRLLRQPERARPQHAARVPAQPRALPVHEVGHAGLRHLPASCRRASASSTRSISSTSRAASTRRRRRAARRRSTTPTRWSAPTATRR